MKTKFTKIVATVSDRRCDVDFIKQLAENGLNVVRMNSAHIQREGFQRIVNNVRAVSDRIGILMDTKGPEIRTTTNVDDENLSFSAGDKVCVTGAPDELSDKQNIHLSYPDIANDVKAGMHLLIDDGELDFLIDSIDGKTLRCTALNDGELGSRKSVNIPGASIKLPSLTQRDIQNIGYAIEMGVDFIAHSFVRSRQDVLDIQKILDANNSPIKIISKIEKETNDRKFGEFKLNTKIDAEGQARVAGDELLNKKIEKETNDRKFGEFKLNTKIDAEGQARVAGDELLNKKIEKETNDRETADKILNTKINAEGQARYENDKMLNNKIDTEIADRKAEVSRLDGRIDKLNDNVQKVGAMAAAIANLHTMGYDPEAPTEIAVGVGQYRDKTGLALGAFHYPNRDFMLSFNVSTAGDEFMGGIGATWKFGRKSPEELRQAEAEKAAKAKLAKAEAAKKAAKDARVAAQQKRHAEMLAARTGK